MDKERSVARLWVAFVFLSLIILSGCSGNVEKGRKPSQDWSRGLPIGDDATSHASLVVNPAGDNVNVIWPFQLDNGDMAFRYVQLDQNAEVITNKELVQLPGMVRTPKLVSGENGLLHLFWVGKEDEAANWLLWYAELDSGGEMRVQPQMLSDVTSNVGSYSVVSDGNFGAVAIWEDVTSNGLKWVRKSIDIPQQSQPELLVQVGTRPSIRLDSHGDFHLSWMEENSLFYDQFSREDSFPIKGTEIARISIGTGASLDDPVLGLSDGWVYVFWSVLNQSGLEAGTATTEYVSFPIGSPQANYPDSFGILSDEVQPFQPYQGIFTLSQWVPAINPIISTEFVYKPVTAQMQLPELVVAVATQQEYRLKVYNQIAVGVFSEGRVKGYTFCTKTFDISGDVVLTADADGNLHVVWRDGFVGSNVFYATTAPQARDNIDRLEFSDLSNVILTSGLESITGIMLFPLSFPWMFIGLVILVVWRLVRNDETLANGISRFLLLLSLVFYQGSKFLIMPTIVTYVPFSAWIDLPTQWKLPLRVGVPVVNFGIAIIIAELLRRKFTLSTLMYYIAIVMVDTTLTLAIYGVNFLGAY